VCVCVCVCVCVAAGNLQASPVITSTAKVTDIHIVIRWLSFPRFKSIVEEAYLTARALNGRPRY